MIRRLAIDGDEWASFVGRSPDATPFHHPAWAGMIAGCYGFQAFALVLSAEDDDRRPVAGIPVIEIRNPLTRRRRWSSLPFTDACPALVAPADAERLVTEIDEHRVANGVAEVEIGGPVAGLPGRVSQRHVQHVLRLDPDPDEVVRRFRSSVRRNIRAARSGDLRLRRALTEADMVDVFYPLQVITRRRLGLPPQPRGFFRALWRDVLAGGLGHLTIVEAAGTPVAAGIFLSLNGMVVYKYGASNPKAWSLRPNNLLFAEEIADACVAGARTFHFGRTDVNDEGLRRFKQGWGAEEEPLPYTRIGSASTREGSGPPKLLRAVIRHAPPFVVRSLGEALYRFAA